MSDEALCMIDAALPDFATIGGGLRRVRIRDFVTPCSIGVHAHEERSKQRIRLNLTLDIAEESVPPTDRLESVVCYDEILSAVRRVIDARHVRLIETLAERVAIVALADARVRRTIVEIEKLDVYPDVASVGVTIVRDNKMPFPP